jgi:HK97 family phage major capsid protein
MPAQGGPQGTIWGLPVYEDANLTTAANAGHMIVGAFSESYILERTGVTLDVSSEAGTSFEQNQTWFRGEERLGFTAARQPSSLYVVSQMP